MAINRKQIMQAFAKTNGKCAYCGTSFAEYHVDWQVDHVQPRARGGSDDLSNLLPSCEVCNRVKGNRTPDEYREYLRRKRMDAWDEYQAQVYPLHIPDGVPLGGWVQAESVITDYLTAMPIVFYAEQIGLLPLPAGKEWPERVREYVGRNPDSEFCDPEFRAWVIDELGPDTTSPDESEEDHGEIGTTQDA